MIKMKNKMNKKGLAPLVVPIIIAIIVGILIFGGGLFAFNLNQIPAFVWVGLIILLIFKFIGGKKR